MSELAEKERRAIKILRMYRGDEPIEVSYSGGKDSDVILALTKMAGYLTELSTRTQLLTRQAQCNIAKIMAWR